MNDLKSYFPIFKNKPDLVYLDNAATAQTPQVVLDAMMDYYTKFNANVHRGLYPISEEATLKYEAVRGIARAFLNASSEKEMVFTRGATEGLNLVARAWGETHLKAEDEIVLTEMEHHSNLVPWQLVAEKTGAVIRYVPLRENGDLNHEAMEKLFGPKTRMVSITGLSNSLGTVVDLSRVVKLARSVGALVCVDAAQLAVHEPIDVQALDVDFLAFSGHKLYGPTGCGVLYGKMQHLESMPPWQGGGDMIRTVTMQSSTWNDVPWKFEAGTPSVAQIIGLGAAMSFVQNIGFEAIQRQDHVLMEYGLERLNSVPGLRILGTQDSQTHHAVISFTMEGIHPHDVSQILGQQGVCVRAGHHCTMPLMQALEILATTRVSFGLYNQKSEVDLLVEGLGKVRKVLG